MSEDDSNLNILFVSGECLPFCANGGVADMTFALSKYIDKYDNADVRVALPLYQNIPDEYKSLFKLVGERTIELNWRKIECAIYEYKWNEITYYFIDNKQYFGRDRLYGYDDDIERFCFFCKAVLEMFPIVSFYPDIIHANDWQSGMTCVFLKVLEWQNPKYEHIKSVFNIHNLTYQGKTDFSMVKDLLNIDDKFAYLFDFFGEANITKASLLCADGVVVVSETYKEEITATDKGNGLQNIFEQIDHKFYAIGNGIDYEYYNPSTDPSIYEKFDENTLDKRITNKIKLQEELGLDVNPDAPLFGFVGYMTTIKGMDLVKEILEEFIQKGIQFVSVGGGSEEYEFFMRSLNEKYPTSVKIMFKYDRAYAKKIYSGADFLFNISSVEPGGLCPMIANKYGCLPIIYKTGGLKDNFFDFKNEDGNAYVLTSYDKNTLTDLIDGILKDFENKEKMQKYIEMGMKKDFNITKCAEKYFKLYNEI